MDCQPCWFLYFINTAASFTWVVGAVGELRRSLRLFKGDKVVDLAKQERRTTHAAQQNWGGWYRACVGRPLTHIQKENQAVLHHAWRCWSVRLLARRVCRWDSSATSSLSSLRSHFSPDRDGRLNKFGTYVCHMETQISFFSAATLKCEPTPKLLYIIFN